MTSQEENKEIVRQFYQGDVDDIIEQISDVASEDAVLHDPLLGEFRGHEGLTEYYRGINEGMGGARLETDDLVAEGDRVTVRWTFSGTHEGSLPGIDVEPTGNEITFSGIDILRFEDGKIAECWSQFDSLGLMQQLGAVPTEDIPSEAA